MSMRPMPLRPPILFSSLTISQRARLLAVDADGHAAGKRDRDFLDRVGGLLRRNGHAKIDQLHAVDAQVFEPAGLVADVQAVFVRAVGFGYRRLDRNLFLFAIGDHLAATGKLAAKLFHPPRRDQLDRRIQGLGRQLKTALVVALAGRSVGIGVGPDLASDLQADFRDQRPGDRRAQQVDALVLGLPLQHGKGKVAAQLFAGVDDPGDFGAAGAGLGQGRLAVLAGLPQVDVDRVDVVALVLKPAQDDRGIQPARIR